jgi:hypothetical protein
MPDMVDASLSLQQRVRRSDDVLFQEVGGEAVLLDLASEQYFGLDPVGTRIWQLIGDGTGLQSIHDCMLAEFDAAPDQLRHDLLALASQLRDAGLIKVE